MSVLAVAALCRWCSVLYLHVLGISFHAHVFLCLKIGLHAQLRFSHMIRAFTY